MLSVLLMFFVLFVFFMMALFSFVLLNVLLLSSLFFYRPFILTLIVFFRKMVLFFDFFSLFFLFYIFSLAWYSGLSLFIYLSFWKFLLLNLSSRDSFSVVFQCFFFYFFLAFFLFYFFDLKVFLWSLFLFFLCKFWFAFSLLAMTFLLTSRIFASLENLIIYISCFLFGFERLVNKEYRLVLLNSELLIPLQDSLHRALVLICNMGQNGLCLWR